MRFIHCALLLIWVLAVLFWHTEAKPFRPESISNIIGKWQRERRVSFDAGLMSRHQAIEDYMRAHEAQRDSIAANDPYGPGRRK